MSTQQPSGEKKKSRVRKNVGKAIAHVKASFNNTIITVVDSAGQVIAWDSAGTIGYKGSRKSTPFAAQRAAEKVADKCKKMGVCWCGARVRVANRRSARSPIPASTSSRLRTARRCRTMAAVPASAAASDRTSLPDRIIHCRLIPH
jgi:ribosomal protein S11